MSNSVKFLKDVIVQKRKEYGRSYGAIEVLFYPVAVEHEGHIMLMNDGLQVRKMKKGTKLLVSFDGKEISEKDFNAKIKKVQKQIDYDWKARIEKEEKERLICSMLKNNERERIEKFITDNRITFEGNVSYLKQLKAQENKEEWHKIANQMVQFAMENHYGKKWVLSFTEVMQMINDQIKYKIG